jgi:hypothetical protein
MLPMKKKKEKQVLLPAGVSKSAPHTVRLILNITTTKGK